VTGPASSPIGPLCSEIHSSTGFAAGTRTTTPHRPNTTDGTAASRSITAAMGPPAQRGRNTVVARATPMPRGTATIIASALVATVP